MNHWYPKIFVSTVLLMAVIGQVIEPKVVTAQTFSADARWAPANTNVLTLINSSKIFNSKLALKERAAEASKAAFDSGVSLVTPNAERILIATNLDLEYMHSVSTVAVYSRARSKFDLNEMANRIGSSVAPIASYGTVLLPNDAMVVKLGPNSVGVMKPGNRQVVSNWLRAATSGGSNHLPPYLVNAMSYADKNADIVIAMHLADAISPAVIRQRLAEMKSVKPEEVASIAQVLEGISGITLGVTIHDSINGSIKVDLASGGLALEKIGKPLLIEILENRGLMIDDISTWTSKATNNQLLISGRLSMAGLRAISSIVSQPLLPEFIDEEKQVDDSAYARSITYMKSLETYVNELSTKKLNNKSLLNYATWFETYAKKIDDFSILNVDPELVELGNGVSDSLRQMATVARESRVKQSKEQSRIRAEVTGNSGGGYGGGYGSPPHRYHSNRSGRLKEVEKAARGDAANAGREIMTSIQSEIKSVRQNMTTKYGVEF